MSVQLTISESRQMGVTGRLVAGETASVEVTGGAPGALYVINAAREVVASCESFSAGVGALNMATEQIAALVAEIPAGRMFCLAAQIQDSDGAVIGYGFLPVVSAPMPDELEDASVDYYVRAPQLAAAFDASQSYTVGDLVTYGGLLYTCSTAHPAGAWDADDFTAVTVAEAIAEGGGSSVTVDSALTASSANPVKSSGIWAHIWGALTAIPDSCASLYAWIVAQLDEMAASFSGAIGVIETALAGKADTSALSNYLDKRIGGTVDGSVEAGHFEATGSIDAPFFYANTQSNDGTVDADIGVFGSIQVNNLALAQHLRYPFGTLASLPTGGAATLVDRTVNRVEITTSAEGAQAALTPTVAAGESGYARDLVLVLDCSAEGVTKEPTINWAGGASPGDTIHAFDGDDDNLAAEAGEVCVYLITEVAAGRLVVARHILAEAAS